MKCTLCRWKVTLGVAHRHFRDVFSEHLHLVTLSAIKHMQEHVTNGCSSFRHKRIPQLS
jgi:hypothetical protein